MSTFSEACSRSVDDPNGFWGEAAQLVSWDRKPKIFFDDSDPLHSRLFSDGTLNACYNVLDRHVIHGRADQTALIYKNPSMISPETFTYAQLLEKVAQFAGVLRDCGVVKGDRVVIYMPNVPEALIAMLATSRLGAVHSVVCGDFTPVEIAARIDDMTPKVIVSISCGLESDGIVEYKSNLDAAIELSRHKPDCNVIVQRPQHEVSMGDKDVDWAQAMKIAQPAECVSVSATDPLYVLHMSIESGGFKSVVRDNGGHVVALNWIIKSLYGVGIGDTWRPGAEAMWAQSHSFIVYAPLLAGAATVMLEGVPSETQDSEGLWTQLSSWWNSDSGLHITTNS